MRWLKHQRPERSADARAPGPSAVAWAIALVAVGAWLAAVLVAAANPPRPIDGNHYERAWLTLRGSPIALTIAAFLGLIAAVYCIRRLLLRRLAWLPGPVEVPDFLVDPVAEGTRAGERTASKRAAAQDPPPVGNLSMLFRERLAAVHLQAPDAFPSAPEPQDFLQLLTSAARTPANIFGTIAGLLASMLPKAAYRVRGTLLRRSGPDPFGVVVQIVTAPGYASPPTFYWDATWEAAVEHAAYAVAGYLLPRTAACRRPPWTAWQGLEMPEGLVGLGTRASEAMRGRRYDQALALYFDAIEADPRNLELRLEVGLLQEKLALWLDAYATYDDLIELAGRSPRRFSVRARERASWRAQARLVLVARYRRAILLGFGERLAGQWGRQQTAETNPRRRAERTALLRRLGPHFRQALDEPFAERLAGPRELEQILPYERALKDILKTSGGLPNPRDEVRLQELFALICEQELRALARAFRRPSVLWNPVGLTRRSVLISAEWADLRRKRARALLGKRGTPPPPQTVEERIAPHLGWRARRDWQAHYNAACTYAIALLHNEPRIAAACDRAPRYTPDERDRFARCALAQLESALAPLDSGGLARRRAWIVSQDPDLTGLRKRRRFAELEARYFPSGNAAPTRPADVHRLELARYITRMLRIAAHALAAEWREREASDCDDDTRLLRWLREERLAVKTFVGAANDHRHWQTRARALKALQQWATAYGRPLPELAYADYGADPIELEDTALDDEVQRRLAALDEKTAAAGARRAQLAGGDADQHDAWLDAVKDATRSVPAATLCRERAQWWDWLGDALLVSADGNGRPYPGLSAPYKRRRLDVVLRVGARPFRRPPPPAAPPS